MRPRLLIARATAGASTLPTARATARTTSLALVVGLCCLVHPAAALAAEPPPPCLLAPLHASVLDPFRPPACRWCPGNRGIEYATAAGTSARAGAAGVVSFAGSVAGTLYVVVNHPTGLRTTYGRLASISVATGQAVAAGTPVGATGTTFFFGVRRGDVYLDPAAFLLGLHHRPRLVPTGGGPRRPDRSPRYSCLAREVVLAGP